MKLSLNYNISLQHIICFHPYTEPVGDLPPPSSTNTYERIFSESPSSCVEFLVLSPIHSYEPTTGRNS